MCFDRIGTRTRQNFASNHPPTGSVNGSYTRDIGMAKRVVGAATFDPATASVTLAPSLAMFPVGEVIEIRGTGINSGQRTVLQQLSGTQLKLDAPPKAEGPITVEIRTP